MSDKSAIEWTDATWNPVTGCTKVSPGYKHRYAERLAKRLHVLIAVIVLGSIHVSRTRSPYRLGTKAKIRE